MSFWGLVQQKGPWKQTASDRRNARVNPTVGGGDVPQGGTLHAGHAYWESSASPYQQNGRLPPPKMSKWAMRSVRVRDQIPYGKYLHPKPSAGIDQTVIVVAGGRKAGSGIYRNRSVGTQTEGNYNANNALQPGSEMAETGTQTAAGDEPPPVGPERTEQDFNIFKSVGHVVGNAINNMMYGSSSGSSKPAPITGKSMTSNGGTQTTGKSTSTTGSQVGRTQKLGNSKINQDNFYQNTETISSGTQTVQPNLVTQRQIPINVAPTVDLDMVYAKYLDIENQKQLAELENNDLQAKYRQALTFGQYLMNEMGINAEQATQVFGGDTTESKEALRELLAEQYADRVYRASRPPMNEVQNSGYQYGDQINTQMVDPKTRPPYIPVANHADMPKPPVFKPPRQEIHIDPGDAGPSRKETEEVKRRPKPKEPIPPPPQAKGYDTEPKKPAKKTKGKGKGKQKAKPGSGSEYELSDGPKEKVYEGPKSYPKRK